MKVLTMLLVEGFGNAQKAIGQYAVSQQSVRTSEQDFLHAAQVMVNTRIFGDEDNPTQWQCPHQDGKIGTIMMSNVRARKIFCNIDSLIDVCVFDGDREMKWTNCMDEYVHMMDLLTLHRNLSSEEVNKFQRRGDWLFRYGCSCRELRASQTTYIWWVVAI